MSLGGVVGQEGVVVGTVGAWCVCAVEHWRFAPEWLKRLRPAMPGTKLEVRGFLGNHLRRPTHPPTNHLAPTLQGVSRRPRTRGLQRARRQELDEAHAWLVRLGQGQQEQGAGWAGVWVGSGEQAVKTRGCCARQAPRNRRLHAPCPSLQEHLVRCPGPLLP